MATHDDIPLSPGQEAALARLQHALEAPSPVAILAGAAGVGKSLVLTRLAARLLEVGRACAGPAPAVALATGHRVADVGVVLLADDAQDCSSDALDRLTATGPVVLAGRGRLFTLVARDDRLLSRVWMRAVVPTFTLDDTRRVVAAGLCGTGDGDPDENVVRAIHEIAAAVPAAIGRLVRQARFFAAGGRKLSVRDIEAIHRRLDIGVA